MEYLLDTNIVLIYLRQSKLKEQLESKLGLFSAFHTLIISVVTLGEIRSLALQRGWATTRTEELAEFENKMLVADIHVERIVEAYAEIDAYSQGRLVGTNVSFSARNMDNNDL